MVKKNLNSVYINDKSLTANILRNVISNKMCGCCPIIPRFLIKTQAVFVNYSAAVILLKISSTPSRNIGQSIIRERMDYIPS